MLEMSRKISSKRHTSLHLIKQYSVSDILAVTNNYRVHYSKEKRDPVVVFTELNFLMVRYLPSRGFTRWNILHTQGQDEHIIITDYAENGSLDNFLSSNARTVFACKTRIIAFGVAQEIQDYTNPFLPVNPLAIEETVQPIIGPDGNQKEHEKMHPITSPVTFSLNQVFSVLDTIQKIAIIRFSLYSTLFRKLQYSRRMVECRLWYRTLAMICFSKT